MSRMTIREARLITNTGEIEDPEKVSTDTVRLIVATLAASKRHNGDIETALTRAELELAFRIQHNL